MDSDSPAELDARLLHLADLLTEQTEEIAKRARIAATADAEYKKAYAKARLMVRASADRKLTDADVSDRATDMTGDEYLAKVSTEAVLRSARDASTNVRSQIDAIRTLCANQRFLLEKGA